LAEITDLPSPCGKPAAAFFKVIPRTSRKAFSVVTSGTMRTPPIAGPQATFSIAATALSRQPSGNVNELERAKLVGKAKCVPL